VETELKNDPSITMLVNNAGTGSVAPMLDANIEKMEQMIARNITALTRLTYAAAPAFVGRGTGTIINIGSVLGISPERLGVGDSFNTVVGHESRISDKQSPTRLAPSFAAPLPAPDTPA